MIDNVRRLGERDSVQTHRKHWLRQLEKHAISVQSRKRVVNAFAARLLRNPGNTGEST